MALLNGQAGHLAGLLVEVFTKRPVEVGGEPRHLAGQALGGAPHGGAVTRAQCGGDLVELVLQRARLIAREQSGPTTASGEEGQGQTEASSQERAT
jgi:hypothetical protein